MRRLLFSLFMLLIVKTAFASQVELNCQPLDKVNLFENLTLKLKMPDTQNGDFAPGDWNSQQVKVSYGGRNDRTSLYVKTRLIGQGTNILSGSFNIGEDFGGARMLLVQDYDNNEIIAVLQTSTDGPMSVETLRCKY